VRRRAILSDCRYIIDTLLEEVQNNSNDTNSVLYNCKLGCNYVGTSAGILVDPEFESGVVKIQRNEISTMSDKERKACESLLIKNQVEASPTNSTFATIAEKVAAKKRRKIEQTEKYMNCSFILGSVAEVERLWSISKHILRDNRKSMTPLVFESLSFLKINSSFWDQGLVSEAMKATRSRRVEKNLEQDNNQHSAE